ncbi:MAG: restriction endonuclease [Rhodobacteraceae bacterium]|nr:restriction endonuclease [Paracoccaceae bacterium]
MEAFYFFLGGALILLFASYYQKKKQAEDRQKKDQVEVLKSLSGGSKKYDEDVKSYELKKKGMFEALNGNYGSMDEWHLATKELRNFIVNDKLAVERLHDYDVYAQIMIHVKTHLTPLQYNVQRAKKYNEYGALVQDDTHLEIERFLLSVGYEDYMASSPQYQNVVLDALNQYGQKLEKKGFDPNTIPSDGFEFEHWVANSLKHFGWDAAATNGAGDQGVDVIAKKQGVSVGIQCKLYSSNVGNKAVQEIIAARGFFDLDYGCVISNAGYTQSAQDLACKSEIKLLSHFDIPNFNRIFLK